MLVRTPIRVRLVAFLLLASASDWSSQCPCYWMLGGTWGNHRTVVGDRVVEEGATSTGTRIVAAVVVVLLVAAVFVVLARVGLWQQTLVPFAVDSVLRLGAGGGVPARVAGGLDLE